MMKRTIALLLAATMLLSLCGCGGSDEKPTAAVPPKPESGSSAASGGGGSDLIEPKPQNGDAAGLGSVLQYTVSFEEDEDFPDDSSRRAAEIIDPAIQTAVAMLNTLPEQEFDVLDCDYSERPIEKDTLADDEAALEWYDFIYEKLSALEDFKLDPQDYGGEEAFYFPFYTAESALMKDHREIFLCGVTWMGDDGMIYPIYFMPGDWVDKPCDDKEAMKNEAAVYDRILDRIFEKMPEGLSNYQKVCYFTFVVTAAAEYDHDYKDSASVYTPYDTMVRGKTVCRGYSLTLYELCRRAGISCWYCEGMVPSGFHAWNRVETTDGMRWLDLTGYDNEGIKDSYADGDAENLFMTQQDIEYLEYREGEFE